MSFQKKLPLHGTHIALYMNMKGVISMFDIERIYGQHNDRTGLTDWFFPAREGVFGPFTSKAAASQALEEFKRDCIVNDNDGGRNSNVCSKLSLLPLDNRLYQPRQRKAA